MALLTTLALAIGPAIVKSLLKMRLGEGVLGDVAPDLVDLVKEQGQKAWEGREAGQRIDRLGEQIAGRLQPIFTHEAARLEAHERAAALRELAETLARTPLTAELVVACRLDPGRLAGQLSQARPEATALLSAGGQALYERLLAEVAVALVEIGSELDSFERLVSASVLHSQDEILDGLIELRERPDREASDFERTYTEALRRSLDRLEVFGVPRMTEVVKRQSLSVAYVNLSVGQRGEAGPEAERHGRGSLRRFAQPPEDEEGRPLERIEAVDQALAGTRRLVVRGEAGSGKSTLLQWIGVRAAGHDFQPPLTHWNGSVPFFIRLRRCVESGFPAPENFPRLEASGVAGAMPPGWVHRQLESGRALVLVDGVDEMPKAQRGAMLERLQDLVALYPLARYLVTSRPAAVNAEEWPDWPGWIESAGFAEVNLQPMSPAQVEAFLDHWHEALRHTASDAEELAEIKRLPAHLKGLLRQRPALRRLATNPLLAAMICTLHRERQQTLPAERLRLYAECVELLLSRRDEARKVPAGPDYPNLSHDQKLALLQSFAYWMLRNGWSDVEVEQADAHFAGRLPHLALDVTGAAEVRKYFVERASLLREPVLGRIDFTHRTFQEYLAAQAALNGAQSPVTRP